MIYVDFPRQMWYCLRHLDLGEEVTKKKQKNKQNSKKQTVKQTKSVRRIASNIFSYELFLSNLFIYLFLFIFIYLLFPFILYLVNILRVFL